MIGPREKDGGDEPLPEPPQTPSPAHDDWSESSDPNFDSDPDDGGD